MRLLLVVVLVVLSACSRPGPAGADDIDVSRALGGEVEAGFERADRPRDFRFPRDHNAHPAFRNEWWYFTGHLQAGTGERFGYQVTFFRIALAPQAPALDSAWAGNQLWMAHVALTDLAAGTHRHGERFAREALGLAGQASGDFSVWVEDWRLTGGAGGTLPWQLQVDAGDFALELDLEALRAPLLQGEAGLSQKGGAPGNASYYYSITRLETTGRLRSGERDHVVRGLSWLDREWSSSALEGGQAGWDWFSLQFDDGADLMLYRLRSEDGTADPHSAGTLLRRSGEERHLQAGEFRLRPLRYWRAPNGARYPVAWSLSVPGAGLDLRVEALLDAQWMDTAVSYWEGAVEVLDAKSGEGLGQGFLEMTGY